MAKCPYYPMKCYVKKKDRTEKCPERCKSRAKLEKTLRELEYSKKSMLPFVRK
jgi:hypothetical protein